MISLLLTAPCLSNRKSEKRPPCPVIDTLEWSFSVFVSFLLSFSFSYPYFHIQEKVYIHCTQTQVSLVPDIPPFTTLPKPTEQPLNHAASSSLLNPLAPSPHPKIKRKQEPTIHNLPNPPNRPPLRLRRALTILRGLSRGFVITIRFPALVFAVG